MVRVEVRAGFGVRVSDLESELGLCLNCCQVFILMLNITHGYAKNYANTHKGV